MSAVSFILGNLDYCIYTHTLSSALKKTLLGAPRLVATSCGVSPKSTCLSSSLGLPSPDWLGRGSADDVRMKCRIVHGLAYWIGQYLSEIH